MRIFKFLFILLILIFGFMLSGINVKTLFAQTSFNERFSITAIEVEGNERVTDATILTYLSVKIGDQITLQSLDRALSQLFTTNLFADIDISREGGHILVSVVENPIINRVNIEGNNVIDDERLLAELDVQPRRVYTRDIAAKATKTLLDIYRLAGRFAARVEPKLVKLDNNRVDLIFEVDEGPLIKIQSIRFIGNKSFSDYSLRQVISSREERWWAFLASADKYDPGRLDFDARLLRQFYLSRGYADIRVERVQGGLLPDRSGFAVTFAINEGVRYRLRDIDFVSEIKSVDVSVLRDLIPLEQGDWYDVRGLEQGLINITNELGNFGYAFVNVTPELHSDAEEEELDITIAIGAARKNFIERIEVVNNTRTTDKVIRRELEIVEGDAYNQLKIDRSLRRIRGLGFFRDVDIQNLRGSSDDQTIVRIEVEEQPTGDLSLGLGYSSIDKSTLSLGINERNFLGTGRGANLSVSLSDTRADYRVGLSEPYFLDRNLRGSIELFNEQVENDTIKVTSSGLGGALSFRAAGDYYHRIGYEYASKDTRQKSDDAKSTTGEENKTLRTSSLTYTVGRETLDNRFDPTEGYVYELSEEYAGVGGDVTYLKSHFRFGYYQPLFYKKVVLGVRGRLGNVDGLGEKVTQSSRFFLGGRSVRGFDGNGIGPRDEGTNSATGGNNFYSGSIEAISSLGLNDDLGMRWTIFSDFGALWGTDYPEGVIGAEDTSTRQSIGFGILWDTAIGPLTFFWADPLAEEAHDKTRRFQFNIGTRF